MDRLEKTTGKALRLLFSCPRSSVFAVCLLRLSLSAGGEAIAPAWAMPAAEALCLQRDSLPEQERDLLEE